MRLVLAILLSAWTASAAEGVITPADVARLRTVTNAAISPLGKHVAYTLSVPRKVFTENDGPAWTELHVVDREGGSRPYVVGEVNVSTVAWRPGGEQISFLAKRSGDKAQALYVIAFDGGEARKLFEHSRDIEVYSWRPDGKAIAFAAKPPEDEQKKKLSGQGFTQKIVEEDFEHTKVWTVAFDREGELGEPAAIDLDGSASALEWNPAGDRLAAAMAPAPLVDDRYMNRRIVVADPVNGETYGVYRPPGKMESFRWSPDGRALAVITSEDRSDPSAGRLAVVPPSGDGARDVLPGLEGHVVDLAWTKNGELLYLADQGLYSTLGSVRPDGTEREERIVPADRMVFSRFSLGGDGSLALLWESAVHPPEVALLEPEARQPKRLTNSNPWLGGVRLARQETVEFKARDGLMLEGVLIRPLAEQPGQRYPLILYVHGGPESREPDGWLTSYVRPGQAAAARGFAVFYPNYRSSTGRGVDFSKLNHGDFAGAEFDDLVDAVDHLVAMGLVDREKVGVTGGSYGGYATAWAATKLTEHFAAGVMFAGISNQISKTAATDIPEEIYEVHHRRRIWNDWEFFLERSPLHHVGKARTPLLILHGENDTRVPATQSLELYRVLKSIGETPVRLVLYPGEGHGNRRTASRYDYHLRMLRWMEHYLLGPGGDPPPHELEYGPAEKE